MTPLADLMVRVKRFDDLGLTARDFVLLGVMHMQPGMMGREIGPAAGYPGRHRDSVVKLLARGFLEDRREIKMSTVPNRFYVTDKGVALLREMSGPL